MRSKESIYEYVTIKILECILSKSKSVVSNEFVIGTILVERDNDVFRDLPNANAGPASSLEDILSVSFDRTKRSLKRIGLELITLEKIDDGRALKFRVEIDERESPSISPIVPLANRYGVKKHYDETSDDEDEWSA